MFSTRIKACVALCILSALPWVRAAAATPVETIPADLRALIRDAADKPNQFAVSVPHRVTTTASGEWSIEDDRHVWSYAAHLPTAVSMSFHAPRMQLPIGALLTVKSAATTMTYRNADTGSGSFWSRVQPGDTLEFRLEVPAEARDDVRLEISSFQAGFRGLSPEVKDHAEIQRVRAMAAGDPDTPCVQNYACYVTPANSPAAQATVAIIVGNEYQCTGTLLNNVLGDQVPYVLTARHCQNGRYGGGAPSAASSITVYWNAMNACGSPLGSLLYAPRTSRQTGATTVVEQQDAWLVRLDSTPVVDDAHFAGFDASGSAINGGYSVHHSLGYSRQFTRWAGVPYVSTRPGVHGVSFTSNFLDTVNELGTTGPGSSGGALFTPADRVAGILSLGGRHPTQSGYGICPVHPVDPPNASNGAASFVSLAAIWNSTSDATSSTGTRTLRSVLDPAATGTLALGSMQAVKLSFTASKYTAQWNTSVTLSWGATNATHCTAWGGSDGWAGTLAGFGTRVVTNSAAGAVSYQIACQLAGGGLVSAALVIYWAAPNAQPQFVDPPSLSWITRPVVLEWRAVIGPCALSGGGVSESDLPASGSLTATSDTPAYVTYDLTCGVPGATSVIRHSVNYVAPVLDFAVSATRRKAGQPLSLAWYSLAETCGPTGGSPDDQWSGTTRVNQGTLTIPALTTPGTYTYGLTCVAGSLSAQKSVQVTVDDAAPFAKLTPARTTVTYSDSPADDIMVHFASNLSVCQFSSSGFGLLSYVNPLLPQPLRTLTYAEGTMIVLPNAAGTFRLGMTCHSSPGTPSATASDEMAFTVLPAPPAQVSLTTSAAQVASGMPFTLSWSASHARSCTGSGGVQEQGIADG